MTSKKSMQKAKKKPSSKKLGRKSKCTKELIAELEKYISTIGLTYKDACLVVGISRQTFHRWMREKSYFCDTIKRAEAMGKAVRLARIAKAAEDPKNWTADAWWLERRYKEEFSKFSNTRKTPPVTPVFGRGKSPFIQPVEEHQQAPKKSVKATIAALRKR